MSKINAVKYKVTVTIDEIHGEYDDINELFIKFEDLSYNQQEKIKDLNEFLNQSTGMVINYTLNTTGMYTVNQFVSNVPRNKIHQHAYKERNNLKDSSLELIELEYNFVDTLVNMFVAKYKIKQYQNMICQEIAKILPKKPHSPLSYDEDFSGEKIDEKTFFEEYDKKQGYGCPLYV